MASNEEQVSGCVLEANFLQAIKSDTCLILTLGSFVAVNMSCREFASVKSELIYKKTRNTISR